MDWTLFVVILQLVLKPSHAVLFTVEAEQTAYQSKFGGDVVMGCRFQPKLPNIHADLKVTWQWIGSTSTREVYHMDNRKERLASRDPDYQGRVELLDAELEQGWAKLQISRLRINDSGTYQCLVQTAEGSDYKTISLSVVAPYKAVTKHTHKAAEGDGVLLTCESEGYPESSVTWHDGHLRSLSHDTNTVSTPDQLFKVTSQIHVWSSEKNNYTCIFTNDGQSATFHIPDEIPVPPVKTDAVAVAWSIGVTMIIVGIIIAVIMCRRRKGPRTHGTKNLFVQGQGRSVSSAACIEKAKDNEEEITIFNEDNPFTVKMSAYALHTRQKQSIFSRYLLPFHENDLDVIMIKSVLLSACCVEENLGAFLKAHYSEFSFSTEVRHHWKAFVSELPKRLQNNKGQPVNLQALLPEAGETLFLEGPPGSGKTTLAHILVSSWTEGNKHALSHLLDLSKLLLLLYVDCSKVKGDLFQEITVQLSLTGKISTEDELKAVLTRSSEALLLLDEYREENKCFDESLRKFLMEKGECRVLVMTCQEHCPILKDTVGTEGVLQLQTV
ncbi:uncharacterized protein LOC141757843 [Sebastes fasciatus]|uniref:uncharacterized protein LOC141757843 n=1 Tax=Sebastes fasciatus TaxID=394691 RepID=UPI003D9DFAB6